MVYILEVFNMRENVRNAMAQDYMEFEDLENALGHVSRKLYLPMSRYISTGRLLDEVLHTRQSRLDDFLLNDKETNYGLICC